MIPSHKFVVRPEYHIHNSNAKSINTVQAGLNIDFLVETQLHHFLISFIQEKRQMRVLWSAQNQEEQY